MSTTSLRQTAADPDALAAKTHWSVPELVIVTSSALRESDGNVVARANLLTGEVWRTRHQGPRPSMAAIRAAVDRVRP